MDVKISLEFGAKYPNRAHIEDAAFDLFNYGVKDINIDKSTITYRTGVHIYLPENYCALVVSKSGLHSRYGIITDGLIDSNYTGEILVTLNYPYHDIKVFDIGDKIAQLLILKLPQICLVDENGLAYQTKFIPEKRGNNGFGSTGK